MKVDNKGRVKKNRGFTLVELLVSSAIFVAIGTIIVIILSITFKISQKTEVTLLLKNNGSNALSQMTNSIKYAESLDDPISCVAPVNQSKITVNQITIRSSFDGGQTVFSCPTDTSTTIASNGASLIDTSSVTVSNCSFSCTQTSSTDAPTITIDFNLSDISSSTNNASVVIPFHTSVTMRNFTK